MTRRQTVEQMAALTVLYRAGHPLGDIEFSERLWGKRNRFATGFLRRLVDLGWVEYAGYPDNTYRLTEAARAILRSAEEG